MQVSLKKWAMQFIEDNERSPERGFHTNRTMDSQYSEW